MEKRQTVRIPNDIGEELNKIIRREDCSKSEALVILAREAISMRKTGILITPVATPKEDGSVTVTAKQAKKYTLEKFILPIGDVINTTHGGRTEPWFCPERKLADVRKLCEAWEQNGFKLNVGEALAQDTYGTNLRYSPSTKMVPGLKGDVPVWLTIEDPTLAIAHMKSHTDIPVVVAYIDWIREGEDPLYKEAVDMSRELFITYFNTGRPKGHYDEGE